MEMFNFDLNYRFKVISFPRMRDDILNIQEHHQIAAKAVIKVIMSEIRKKKGKYLLTIAGESGAGKTEIAFSLSSLLETAGIKAYIIQQDDYFKFPPKTNARLREKDIRHVGPGEVRLDLLNETIKLILANQNPVVKPLVIFSEDSITTEHLDPASFQVIIIEGTYTTLLENINCRIFIDRDYLDTREDRQKRNREKQDDYLEKILEIEHAIISTHKRLADIIISKEFKVSRNL